MAAIEQGEKIPTALSVFDGIIKDHNSLCCLFKHLNEFTSDTERKNAINEIRRAVEDALNIDSSVPGVDQVRNAANDLVETASEISPLYLQALNMFNEQVNEYEQIIKMLGTDDRKIIHKADLIELSRAVESMQEVFRPYSERSLEFHEKIEYLRDRCQSMVEQVQQDVEVLEKELTNSKLSEEEHRQRRETVEKKTRMIVLGISGGMAALLFGTAVGLAAYAAAGTAATASVAGATAGAGGTTAGGTVVAEGATVGTMTAAASMASAGASGASRALPLFTGLLGKLKAVANAANALLDITVDFFASLWLKLTGSGQPNAARDPSLAKRLEESKLRLADLEAMLTQSDKLVEKTKAVNQRNEQISSALEIASEKVEEQIKDREKDEQIAEKDEQIAEKDEQISEKDELIAKLQEELKQLKGQS